MGRRKTWSAEKIISTLRQIEVQTVQGKGLAQACKEAGISEQGRDRRLEGARQVREAALKPELPTTRASDPPGPSAPTTHTSHHALVSHSPAQNPGQVICPSLHSKHGRVLIRQVNTRRLTTCAYRFSLFSRPRTRSDSDSVMARYKNATTL
jgi:putative transposase